MTLRRSLTLLTALLFSLGVFFFLKTPHKSQNFIQIPVSFFPFIDRPIIKIKIEDKDYSLLIDLGSSHPMDLSKKAMQKIKSKKPLDISNYVGIRGKKYPTQSFQLPRVKLSNLAIDDLIGFEENVDFLNDARTWQSSGFLSELKDQLEFLMIDGRIGWTFFKSGVSFFDFSHSRLIIAKNLSTLVNEAGFCLKDFTQIPFEFQNCGLVLSIQTSLGLQKFLLDTGSTCSILRESRFPEKMRQGESPFITDTLRIGENEFGNWIFRLLEYNDQMECDGILGIDFFKKHTICLDFLSNTAYVK